MARIMRLGGTERIIERDALRERTGAQLVSSALQIKYLIMGEPIRMKLLPEGRCQHGRLLGSRGRVLEVELEDRPGDEPGDEFAPGAAAELENEEAVLLGMIERRENRRLWISVEHRLELRSLEILRQAWREPVRAAGGRRI
jgi:hypothetical protein